MRIDELFEPRKHVNFLKWFGDSKIVDADGNPLRCYHGTRASDFEKFTLDNTSEKVMGYSPAFFFTANPNVSNEYTGDYGQTVPVFLRITNPLRLPRYSNTSDLINILGPEVEELNDTISKTYGSYFRDVGRTQTFYYFKDQWGEHLIDLAKKRGYDGLIFPETSIGRSEYDNTIVAFSANQIKSAIGSGYSLESDGISEAESA